MPRLPSGRSLGLGFHGIIEHPNGRTQNHLISRAALEVIERPVALDPVYISRRERCRGPRSSSRKSSGQGREFGRGRGALGA